MAIGAVVVGERNRQEMGIVVAARRMVVLVVVADFAATMLETVVEEDRGPRLLVVVVVPPEIIHSAEVAGQLMTGGFCFQMLLVEMQKMLVDRSLPRHCYDHHCFDCFGRYCLLKVLQD